MITNDQNTASIIGYKSAISLEQAIADADKETYEEEEIKK